MTYPECEKLSAVAEISQAQGEFIEFLRQEGWRVTNAEDEHWHLSEGEMVRMLAKFHGIDLDKVETERRQILASLQS